MRYRQVGCSGLLVSELSLGTWGGGLPAAAEHLGSCVGAALDVGVTTFHSSPDWMGGDVETALGAALAGEDRDRLVLCSGLYPGPAAWAAHPKAADPDFRLSRTRIFAGVRGALRRLRTDHLDVLCLMRFDDRTPLEETLTAVADLVRQGSVHYLMTSEWTADQLATARAQTQDLRVELVADHSHYSMLWRAPETRVARLTERVGMGQMAYAPLAQGVLTGKYCGTSPRPGTRATAGGAPPTRMPLDEEVLERVDRMAFSLWCCPACTPPGSRPGARSRPLPRRGK
jgi:aryl-alcohol dehydrogenase-like predicted oxidoreductase